MLCSFRGERIKIHAKYNFQEINIFFFFLLISHRVLGIILSSLLIFSLWSMVGGLARSRGLAYRASENHSMPECRTRCWASHSVFLLNPALCDLGHSVCLFALLQFMLLPSSSHWPFWCFPTSVLKAAGQNGKVSIVANEKRTATPRWGFLLRCSLPQLWAGILNKLWD